MKSKMTGLILIPCLFFLVTTAFANAKHCDFNNDGFDDLAIGVPGEEGVGAVSVLYGRAGGLSATNNQFIWTGFTGTGQVLECGDFNGDGRDDMAIGAADSSENLQPLSGAVYVMYASATGRLTHTGAQTWTQNSPGIADETEPDDRFGFALAAGDFNADGYDDLAIAAPGEELTPGAINAGAVHIIYGSANKLSGALSQFFTQTSIGLDPSELLDEFGSALEAANFGNDTLGGCYDDLAIGSRGESISAMGNAGSVHVVYGSSTGISLIGKQLWTLNSPGILGDVGNDTFGGSLQAGSFHGTQSVCGSTLQDLAIGAPTRIVSGVMNTGAVYVLYTTDTGLSSAGSQVWHQNSTDIADNPEAFEAFGNSLATGRSSTGTDYLAIGVYGETISNVSACGAVHVLFVNAATGYLTGAGSKFYHQNTPGIQDTVEFNELFGYAVATGNYDGNGADDLTIGVPAEDFAEVDAGAVHILRDGLPTNTKFFHQGSADMKDDDEISDNFGWSFTH